MSVPHAILPAGEAHEAKEWLSQLDPAWITRAKAGLRNIYPGFEAAPDAVQVTHLLDHFFGTDAADCLRGSLPDIVVSKDFLYTLSHRAASLFSIKS